MGGGARQEGRKGYSLKTKKRKEKTPGYQERATTRKCTVHLDLNKRGIKCAQNGKGGRVERKGKKGRGRFLLYFCDTTKTPTTPPPQKEVRKEN